MAAIYRNTKNHAVLRLYNLVHEFGSLSRLHVQIGFAAVCGVCVDDRKLPVCLCITEEPGCNCIPIFFFFFI